MHFGFSFCYASCFCFYVFYGWVLVSMGDPFYRVFVMILAGSILFQSLQGGCSFPSQIGLHISAPAKGLLLLTGLKTLQRATPLLNTDLAFSPLCVDKPLALSKVDRFGKFSIPLGLKKITFPTRLLFVGSALLVLDSLLGSPPHCFNLVTLLL
jgi:hypothetical protein